MGTPRFLVEPSALAEKLKFLKSQSVQTFLASIILLTLLFSIFLPLLIGPSEFNGDDLGYVNQRDETTSKLYTPLTNLTFIIEKQVWDSNPKGYRLTNIFLMFLVALYAWKLALQFRPKPAARLFVSDRSSTSARFISFAATISDR